MQRLPMYRNTESSDFDANNNKTVFTLRYDPNADPLDPTDADSDSTMASPKPIAIHAYDFTVAVNCLAEIWQWYGMTENQAKLEEFDLSDQTFLQGFKNSTLAAGTVLLRSGDTNSSQWNVRTLRFRSKRYWSKKHKEYRWVIPPIILSPNKKTMMGFSLKNVGDQDNRSYYTHLKIARWHQAT
ncbi:MAG TPA: hypothetical protein EYN67_04820 [Flavobacteriales bacterium]|nr:hypothetical protein [Flavobacteriales bacterium]HIB78473.1 hypothetical protein [Flavobacteriales bacterium]